MNQVKFREIEGMLNLYDFSSLESIFIIFRDSWKNVQVLMIVDIFNRISIKQVKST